VAVANSAVLPEGKAGSNPAVTSTTPGKHDVLIGERCPANAGVVTHEASVSPIEPDKIRVREGIQKVNSHQMRI